MVLSPAKCTHIPISLHTAARATEVPPRLPAPHTVRLKDRSRPSGPPHTDVRISGTKLWQRFMSYVHKQWTIEQLPHFRFRFWQKCDTFLPQSPSDPCPFCSRFRPNPPWVTLRQSLCGQQSSTCSLRIILILPQSS